MKTLLSTLLILLTTQITQAQSSWSVKDSSTVLKLEKYVKIAEDKVDDANMKITFGDSLLQTGTSQLNKGKSNVKALKEEQKYLEKQYDSNQKTLYSMLNSDDSDEVNEARIRMKEVKKQYSTDSQDLFARIRNNDKLISTGERNIDKGKQYLKDYKKKQKEAENNLLLAKANLNSKLDELGVSTMATSEK